MRGRCCTPLRGAPQPASQRLRGLQEAHFNCPVVLYPDGKLGTWRTQASLSSANVWMVNEEIEVSGGDKSSYLIEKLPQGNQEEFGPRRQTPVFFRVAENLIKYERTQIQLSDREATFPDLAHQVLSIPELLPEPHPRPEKPFCRLAWTPGACSSLSPGPVFSEPLTILITFSLESDLCLA